MKCLKDEAPDLYDMVTVGWVRNDGNTIARLTLDEALAALQARNNELDKPGSPREQRLHVLRLEFLRTLCQTLSGLQYFSTIEMRLCEGEIPTDLHKCVADIDHDEFINYFGGKSVAVFRAYIDSGFARLNAWAKFMEQKERTLRGVEPQESGNVSSAAKVPALKLADEHGVEIA